MQTTGFKRLTMGSNTKCRRCKATIRKGRYAWKTTQAAIYCNPCKDRIEREQRQAVHRLMRDL